MLCYHPLIKLNEKKLLSVYKKSFVSYKHFKEKKQLSKLINIGDINLYPCGKCLACLNMNRFHWVKKLELEKQNSKNCYFITLTYSDANLPYGLNVKHLQNFIKYLRRLKPDFTFRYFACGEYGSRTHRPHYHMILFTDYDLELIFLKNTNNGPLFDCPLLNKCWLNRGYIWVAYDINSASFAYVSSYSSKAYLKQSQNLKYKEFYINRDNIYNDDQLSGFEKYSMVDYLISTIKFNKAEFIICSKRPPLGSLANDYINSPSSLLYWFIKRDNINYLYKKYNNNVDAELLEFAKKKNVSFLDSDFFNTIEKRKKYFNEFVSRNDIYNIIENNVILKNKNDVRKNKKL